MFGEPAPGMGLVLGPAVAGASGAPEEVDARGGACTGGPPAVPRSRLRKRSSMLGAAVPGRSGAAAAGRLSSQALNSRSEIRPSWFASTEPNGVPACEPSFHSSGEITPSLFLSIARKRSEDVTPLALALPRAALHSRNSLSEILPSPFRSTTVNGTGATG